ncbi:hypothetical protein BpHYR1_031803 [Brachionus plicatilis]|uniref:Uncharacterized protein n=1 Tax=Brachionus plicatilis TaxID=10195 RepID=A0A3M7PTU5_BRAPC|nr:hypothetical protein BpHYR1_031803 [Brachionus plicatilis]
MTSESALLLSPGSKRKNEERQSTSTRVLANHLKVEHNVTNPSFEDSDSEFENFTSPKVIRVSEQSRITDLFLTFLINNIQAFMLADDPDFKRFIDSLNNKYIIPCRKTVLDNFSINDKTLSVQPIMLQTWSALGKCSVVLMKIECILDVLYISYI